MKELLVTAKTVDKALEIGYEKLDANPEQCSYEIINLPKKGLFGKIKKEAEVKIFLIDGIESDKKSCLYGEKQNQNSVETDKNQQQNNVVKHIDIQVIKQKETDLLNEILSNICGNNNFEFNIDVNEKLSKINIKCEEPKMVIGRKGETLDSIQYLLSLTISNLIDCSHRIHLDCNGYREDRENYIIELSKKSADFVLQTKRKKFLDYMNSYERRIVHSTISEIDGVTSFSSGVEPNRKVVISIRNN